MSLKVVCWNANGLEELKQFFHEKNVDIALISETPSTSYRSLSKLRNFAVYLANHPSGAARGGAATLVRKSIQHHDLGAYVTASMQSVVITIKINNRLTSVGSIYCPSRHPPNEREFEKLFNHLGDH